MRLPLICPFCGAPETGRVDAKEKSGSLIILVMFDCPFYTKLTKSDLESEENAQKRLDEWRTKFGQEWLDTIGPVLRARELRNIERRLKAGS